MNLNNYRLPALTAILGLLAGYWLTTTYMPRVETKMVTLDHDVIHNQIVVHTVIKQADGTTTTVDSTDTSTHTSDASTSAISFKVPQWRIGLLTAGPGVYGASVERKLLGPLSAALTADSQAHYTIGINYEF